MFAKTMLLVMVLCAVLILAGSSQVVLAQADGDDAEDPNLIYLPFASIDSGYYVGEEKSGEQVTAAMTTSTGPGLNVIVNSNFDVIQKNAAWRSWNTSTIWIGKEGDVIGARVFPGSDPNVQMYQPFVPLKPNTRYQLLMRAKLLGFDTTENTGISVYVHKHGSPYTNYVAGSSAMVLGRGLRQADGWAAFTTTFDTNSMAQNDARLRVTFDRPRTPHSSLVYVIDYVYLIEQCQVGGTGADACLWDIEAVGPPAPAD